MNGGTNLALAIEEAGKMMKECLPEGSPRTLVLLSDGRVDHYQGLLYPNTAAASCSYVQ